MTQSAAIKSAQRFHGYPVVFDLSAAVADITCGGRAVAAHLTAIQSALKMLSGRIGVLYLHIQKMQDGDSRSFDVQGYMLSVVF